MAVFKYKGINKSGKNISGMVDADSANAAKLKLRKDGIFPTNIFESHGSGGAAQEESKGIKKEINFGQYFNKIKIQELAEMTRQLSTLVGANVPLIESLAALVEQIENVKLKTVLSQIKDSVNEGSNLGEAMESHPEIFSNLYINMVKAGEASGALDVVLVKLADFSEKQAKLMSKIKGTMAYPIAMSCFAVIIVIVLLTFVIPKIQAIFDSMKVSLPAITVFLLGTSDLLLNYWWMVLILGGMGYYFFKKWVKTPQGLRKYHQIQLKLPIFGRLQRLSVISSFTATLSTLLTAGVPLIKALTIVRSLVSNVILREVVEKTIEEVSEGKNLADPLRDSKEFPPVVIHMIAIGEKTGQLEEMLKVVAKSYETQVENTISTLTSLLEPIIIVVMGGVIGFIVMAVLLPILSINQMVH